MEMGKKKAPEGFLPEPFLPASPFLKGTYSRTFNFITLVLILPLVLPHGVIGPSAKKRMDTAWYYLDYLIIKNQIPQFRRKMIKLKALLHLMGDCF